MKAYNQTWIENLDFRAILTNWHQKKLLTDEQFEASKAENPVEFYRPNWFIRIGLFIFTNIIAAFSSSFFGFFFAMADSQFGFGILCFIIGSALFFVLEIFIKNRKVYRSGIDNALLYAGIGMIYTGIMLFASFSFSSWVYPLILFLLLIPALIRYGDPIVAFVAFCSFFGFVFFAMTTFSIGKLILPFVVMILSAVIYFLSKNRKKDSYYTDSQNVTELMSLILFYLGGNYLVVREANALLNDVPKSIEIAFSWLFWIFTFLIPALYIFYAINQKDRKPLFVALLAIGFSIFTYRFYYSIMPVEYALSLGGIILIAFSIWATRYFKTTKHNLTYQPEAADKFQNLEAIIVSQTFQNQPQQNSSQFGGGNFGGGGAGGEV